ncbi:hypothetical protein DRW48_05200 [Paracoccus suum]|uniref:LPS export ABC transporter periplasmic protein LptC n=1 Tax=Paracoccus suum TaxID=2259340 RepID=A0A344PIF3_9RHOB|nr:hypothetical protein [Paracoccus suum]AXC49158.1 hypothetical protein DRW48_05200 [Paracoccus suum]
MAAVRVPGNLRSCIVAWLRVLLPLAALAILSTLFLLSRRPDPERAIPYASVDAEARARDPQITAPTYAGVTPDGARISLIADSATPARDGDGIGGAKGLRLDWHAQDGLEAWLTAPQARMEGGDITLTGGVMVRTSTGWRLDAPQVTTSTNRALIGAEGGVAAQAPFGEVTASTMQITRQPAAEGAPEAHVLDFTGGVRLVYLP